jgi:predicted nucleotidyltransferase
MALKAYLTADEHDKLDEGSRKAYVAAGEGFRLDVEAVDGWRLENVDALVSGKARLKKDYDELREKTKAYEGIDAAEARKALEKIKTLGDGNDSKASEKIEAIRKQLLDEFAQKEQGYQTQAQQLESQLQRHLIEAAASQALAKHKGDAALLMPHLAGAVRAVKNDKGQYAIKVVDQDGQPLGSKLSGRAGEDMDVDELVSGVYKQKFPAAFEGTNSTGSGANGSTRSAGGANRFTITREQARDPKTYQTVRAQAVAAGQQISIVE